MKRQPLSPDDLQHYHDHGYVMLGRVLSDGQLEALRAEELRFRSQRNAINPVGNGQTAFFGLIASYSAPVRDVINAGAHLNALEQLIGPNLATWYNQFVTKMPDGGMAKSDFPWHQDNGYAMVEPPTNVTVWIALDDVNEQNGCVWIQPGSHFAGLLPHKSKNPDSWHLTLEVEGDGVPAVMKAGEAIAFSGLTLHRSKFNLTDQPRRAFFMEYCLPEAKWTDGTNGSTQIRNVTCREDAWVVRGQAPLPAGF